MNDFIYCANVGDSRAVLINNDPMSNTLKLVEMSKDHKPLDHEERKRIQQHGGRVEPYKMPNGASIGPARVWKESENVPGLMMSRSFGDKTGHECGIICTPEIRHQKLDSNCVALVLGSDGIFEMLSPG